MTARWKLHDHCCRASGSDLLLTDSCLLGFEAPQVRLLSKLSVLLQECDDGAAAKDKFHPRVAGAQLALLKDIWFYECKYSLVTPLLFLFSGENRY